LSVPPQPPGRQQYFLGLGLGSIPLIAFFIGFAPNATILYIVAAVLYIGVLIAAIVCTIIARLRPVGYGLLTAFLVVPVVAAIGCVIIVSRPRG
jgi:hypothetical protein